MQTQKNIKKEFLLGHERKTKKEMWLSHQDMQTHNLVLGSCGSGKTEALCGLANNAIIQGSGLIFIDGKGSVNLYGKILSMARAAGREDDVLLINQMTGNRNANNPTTTKISNSFNPFQHGSAADLTELLVSMMDDSGGEGGMRKNRAASLISAVMMSLVFMREEKEILLDVNVIREYLILDNIIKLYKTRLDLPENARKVLRAYLTSLLGFQENAPKQNETVLEQHGYLQMQFTSLLSSLSNNYDYTLNTQLSEINFTDVVLNRRILVVLLPALEKSQDDLANLGKVVVSCLKMVMTEKLNATILNKSAATSTFMSIFDEYGYYAPKGGATMPLQAHRLGISMTFAGQDLPSFNKVSKEDAESIIANCNTKIFMKTEDPKDTYDLFKKHQGDAAANRNKFIDLQDQHPGDAHVIFKSTVTRTTMLYLQFDFLNSIRINQFLLIKTPEIEDLTDDKIITNPIFVDSNVKPLNNDEIRMPNPFPVASNPFKIITTFFKSEKATFPFTAPANGLNLASLSLTDGDYAMAKTPREFCLQHDLLNNPDVEWPNELNIEKTAKVFTSQLGPLWNGYQNLDTISRCLFGIFAAQIAGEPSQAMDALEKISLSATPGEKPDFTAGLNLAEKYHSHENVVKIVSNHAYIYTTLYQLLLNARENNILPSSWFIWLRPLNRTLYYALNSVGREVSWTESGGVFSHWKAETVKGKPIKNPYIQPAVFALQKALA